MWYNSVMVHCTVLVVEHEWRMRKLIRANLEALGMVVHEAVNMEHGSGMLSQDCPDLIILDLDPSGMDVLNALTMADARAGREVPILALSAEPPGRQFGMQELSLSHLQKPFSVPMLLQHVQSALAQAGRGDSVPGDMPRFAPGAS